MGFLTAVRFLTILPFPDRKGASESIGKSLPYFPLVGLLLGLILLGLHYLFSLVLPPAVAAILLVIALTVMTGAHHIDGLSDTCDALAIGKSRDQRLDIMADTRVGSFGITGVCLALIAKFATLTVTAPFPALLLMSVLARWAVAGVIPSFPSARASGLGFSARKDARWLHFLIASILTLVIVMLLAGLARGAILLTATFIPVFLLAALLNRLFGGLTGDCYGALIEIGEVIGLILMLILTDVWSYPDINPVDLLGCGC